MTTTTAAPPSADRITEVGLSLRIQAFENAKFRADAGAAMTESEKSEFNQQVDFARAIWRLAAPQTSVGEQADERALFEAWLRGRWPNAQRPIDEKTAAGSYMFTENNLLWEAWQARAAIAQGASSAPADEATRLRKVLVDVRHALQFANDTPNGAISDTLWMMNEPETVFDFIDAALAAPTATPASASGEHNSQDPNCSCPSGNGSLTWPCLVHPPAASPSREEAPAAQAVAAAPADPVYQVRGAMGGWRDVDESHYSSFRDKDRRVVFAAPAASVAQAEDAKDAARYRVLRMHVKPGDVNLAMTRRPPPHQTASERIDMLCDLAMSSTQHSAKAGGDK